MVGKTKKTPSEEEGGEFSFDPGSQYEFKVEDTCCITGEELPYSFCRFPDYRRGTLMVMSKRAAIEHLRHESTIEKFKQVLVERHGKGVLKEYKS